MKVRIIDESQLTRPYISKKAMMKIVVAKDKHFEDQLYKTKCARHDSEEWMHLAEDEKLMLNKMQKQLDYQVKLTYMLSIGSAIIGSLVGFMLHG